MNEENEMMDFEGEEPISINELAGQVIEVDAGNLEVVQSPELLSEVLITLASMIGEETGAEVYSMSGDIHAQQGKSLIDQSGEFTQTFKANIPVGDDTGNYELKMHGTWNVAEHDTLDEDGGEMDVVTRMTIEVNIDAVTKL